MKISHTILTILTIISCVLPASGALDPEPSDDGFLITAEQVEGREGARGRIVYLEGKVTIERRGARLQGEHGIYRESEGIAIVFGNVHGTDEGSTIACDTLEYYRDTDVAVLIGNASFADSSGVTNARRIEVLRRQNVAVCSGDVVSYDTEGTTELRSGMLVYDFDRSEARASGQPMRR